MSHRALLEIWFFIAIYVAAVIAVPYLSEQGRSALWWGCGILIFAGLPVLAGGLWKRFSRASTTVALALLLVGFLAFGGMFGVVPAQYELALEGFILPTASVLTFVSTGWLVSHLRSRRWAWACIALAGVLCGTMTDFVTISFILFLV